MVEGLLLTVYLLIFADVEMCSAGSSSFRKMAEVGAFQRLSQWQRAERIPAGGDELVTVQLVQQVNRLNNILYYYLLALHECRLWRSAILFEQWC